MPVTELIRKTKEGLLFKIYVQPRAAGNTVAGIHGDALKIRLTAPPVEGAANKMCLRFLSKQLNVPGSALEIKSGHSSRTKIILCRCDQTKGSKTELPKVKKALAALYRKP